MANIIPRKLPVGIQSFKRMREEGYVYVDKTDIVWHMANCGYKYNYLSRPRRFGKSLLVDTLQWYFEGKKELFEGLKIMNLEKEWTVHPVVRLDMSNAGDTAASIRTYLNDVFLKYEQQYGLEPMGKDDLLSIRLSNIFQAAYQKTGQRVVMLIDEFDYPLQHSWKTSGHDDCTRVYREVFSAVKGDDEYEHFVFISGITKFTQISLFSVLNNLTNISFLPEYAPLCGITEAEISENFQPELERMAERNRWTPQETHDRLKTYYDGYHFSDDNMVDIYNPYSLVLALSQSKLRNYWASSGATSLLPKFVKDAEIRMSDFENCPIMRNTLETSDVTNGSAELFLYQTGYLTIKRADEFGYILGFPNEEVKQALFEVCSPCPSRQTAGS